LNGAKTRDWARRPLEEHVEDRLDAICYKIEKREKLRKQYSIKEKEDREGQTAGCKEIKDLLQGMLINNAQSADKTRLAMIRATAAGCQSNEDRAVTVMVHRHQALAGGLCATSVKKYIAALNCWEQFATTLGGHPPGKELPPTVDGLAAWSRMFSIRRTFTGYMVNLRSACMLAGVKIDAFSDPIIRKAEWTVKQMQAPKKEKLFITMTVLEKLITTVRRETDWASEFAYILSYAFMLRVQNECLPVRIGDPVEWDTGLQEGAHSCLFIKDNKAFLMLKKRKNMKDGARIVRECWCQQSTKTCPVHGLGRFIKKMDVGHTPLQGLNLRRFNEELRTRLVHNKIAKGRLFSSHDFRRGHSKDLTDKGSNIGQILAAGQWSSTAFMAYQNKQEIETKAVKALHEVDDSEESSVLSPDDE